MQDLLDEVRRRGIRLQVEDGKLTYLAPQGALDAGLAGQLRERKEDLIRLLAPAAAREPIPTQQRGEPLPLSFAQQRMWFLWCLDPASTAYCVPVATRIDGLLDADALRAAFAVLRARHEVLRSRIVEQDGIPMQAPAEATLDFVLVDLAAQGDEAALRHIRSEQERPVDLRREFPFQIRLYRTGPDRHFLLMRLHHIAYDGWSNQLLIRELWQAYAALRGGAEPELAELPIQYADFAAWQRLRFSDPERSASLIFWEERLSGCDPRLNLPLPPPRAGGTARPVAEARFVVDESVRVALGRIGLQHGATMFMTLLSAWRVLLARYADQRDFVVGTPAIRRSHPDCESVVGYFGNTLLMRNALRPDDTFGSLLRREREAALAAYAHQEAPLDLVVERLAQRGEHDASAASDIMFLFGERAPAVYPVGDLRVEFLELAASGVKFGLGLWIKELPAGGLGGHIEYSPRTFEPEAVERMAADFTRLLAAVARDPDMRLDSVMLLDAAEVDALAATAREAAGRTAPYRSIAARISDRAHEAPDAIAIHWRGAAWSYSKLERLIAGLTRRLAEMGVGEGDAVILSTARSPAMVAAMVAAMRTGAAYVPIDPQLPEYRARMLAQEVGAKAVMTTIAQAIDWRDLCGPVIAIDAVEPADMPDPPGREPSADAVAYILHTSGSTGVPKGVEITHGAAAQMIAWALDSFSPDELRCVLAATSISFDLSVFELFVPLCGGHSLVLAEDALDPDGLGDERVTLINTVPSVMRSLLDAGRRFPAGLRTVCLAGERLDSSLVARVYRATGAGSVYDLYGPTEATTYATCKRREPDGDESIGRPIADFRAYVLDSRGEPRPPDVTGELYLAGTMLARGYRNQPAWTAEKFAAPRCDCVPEERLYRTGDLVRRRRNGELEYVGRRDDQLKLRGFRIEPGEVRSELLALGGVDDAAVAGGEGPDGAAALIAWVVGARESVAQDRLRSALAERLPAHMVPAAFVRVDCIPLTSNGKVDRRALPAPAWGRQQPHGRFSALEAKIARIWADVLQVPVAGDCDFFAIGGTSLSAMAAVGRINSALETQMPLRSMFELRRLSAVARLVGNLPRTAAITLPRAALDHDVPTTLLQQNLWRAHHAAADPAYLNLWRSFALPPEADLAILPQALAQLAAAHPVLRARFPAERRGLIQRFCRAAADPEIHDPGGAGTAADEPARLGELIYETGRPFDLAEGPCYRVAAIRRGRDPTLVLLVVHHILADEWSVDRLADELRGLMLGMPGTTPTGAEANFADYALWERECRADDRFRAQREWWLRDLAPPLGAPAFVATDDAERRTARFTIPHDLWQLLSRGAAATGTTMFAALLGILALQLARRTGEADQRVCTNHARRMHSATEAMVGPLNDLLIVRTRLHGTDSAKAAVAVADAQLRSCLDALDIPFAEVLTAMSREHGIMPKTLAPCFFMLHERDAMREAEQTGIRLNSEYLTSAAHDFALLLNIERSGVEVNGELVTTGQPDMPAAELTDEYVALLGELAGEWGQ